MRDDPDTIKFTDGYYEWVPDGEYLAKCINYSRPIPYFGTRKVFLTFVLLTEPYAGKELFMALNVPYSGIRPGSNYFKFWTVANENRMPSPNAEMSARKFVNKIYRVTTRTTKPKRGKEEMSMDYWYSVVDTIRLENLPDTEDGEEACQS